jgi:hypothetical protein
MAVNVSIALYSALYTVGVVRVTREADRPTVEVRNTAEEIDPYRRKLGLFAVSVYSDGRRFTGRSGSPPVGTAASASNSHTTVNPAMDL